MTEFQRALSDWQQAIGASSVTADPSAVNQAEVATFATAQKILAVLKPQNVQQIQSCLAIANRYRIPFYPISRGRNCGYGSKVPYQDGSVLLDLANLNRISNYNEEMACVTIEPGVTQEQLSSFLKEKGQRLWMDPISTFPDCSVIGNVLERGHGMTPYGDRISFACDYEVVLPTGELMHTGLSAFPNARAAGLDRWAPGPNLEGLFSQSNLGIVTRMTIWLMPAPDYVRAIGFSLSSSEQFVGAIDSLRALRLDGTLKLGPRFFNEYRLLETFSRYPWEKMENRTPLSEACLSELRRELKIPLWTGLLGLYGSREQVAASEARVLKALGNTAQDLTFLDAEVVQKTAPEKRSVFEKFLHSNFQGMCGHVGTVTQRPRWRKKMNSQAPSADWSQDLCGIIWCPVSSPFRGKDTFEAVQLYRDIVRQFGFEPDMSVSAIRDRTLEINASIVFDREDPEQEKKALACAQHLILRLAEAGFYPHRVGLPTQGELMKVPNETRAVISKLRACLDPHQLLASGRYVSETLNPVTKKIK